MKDGLAELPGVASHAPRAPGRSAGIVPFAVAGVAPDEGGARLFARGVIASATPYRASCARVTPGLWNDADEVDRAIAAIGEVPRG
jgi:selenocysteine lyase/cysteine desulfurase